MMIVNSYYNGFYDADKKWKDKIKQRKQELEQENEKEADICRQAIILELENLLSNKRGGK